ncbi:uncharacterized protein F4807DRAFT_417493 [Annulohypoxylon truncatum]|uniref:uncharacterized protein n=1 Tax=Annulohypoxylon truncatum TaxID=327061 RepID=UPI0020079D64|nr:uncharacterized protein F4807DRAFT_417493 [Annulohypoxylon truncatum]KAI1212082.1 hypothetical protein F4807DRAFT_417493 [Annulohypoxylon truncatum]
METAMRNMSRSVDSTKGEAIISEDLYSMETTSTSDSKSYDTTFSQTRFPYHSPCHTTPSHSRPSTPSQYQKNITDAELRGIGDLEHSSNSTHFKVGMSDSVEHRQHFQSDRDANFHIVESVPFVPPSAENWNPDKNGTQMAYHYGVATPNGLRPSRSSPNTSTADGVLVDPASPDSFSIYEESSNSDALSDDEDLDLEKYAGEALSGWFGIDIRRLSRPVRVYCAFEEVKRQCADILQDEGYCLQGTPDEQDNEDSQDVQMDPYDAGESSGSSHLGGSLADKTSTSPFNNKKPSSHNLIQQGSSPESSTKVKGKNKKNQVDEQLACPYRKRNAIRFNVREYPKCANTSYPNMSQLKKHLTSTHAFIRTDAKNSRCGRCRKTFPREEIKDHIETCDYPPRTQLKSISSSLDTNPEDGFDRIIESRLASRGPDRIIEWTTLYRALFPADEEIPKPDFEPVVENYDVAENYKRTKPTLVRYIGELISQHHLGSLLNYDLGGHIIDLFEKNINNILERPMGIVKNPNNHENYSHHETRTFHSPESEFIHIGTESLESINITPQYLSPTDNQGQTLEESQQFFDRPPNVNFLPSSSTSQAAMDTFNPILLGRSRPPQIESQFDNSYFSRGNNTYSGNIPVAAAEPTSWINEDHNHARILPPFGETMLLQENGNPQNNENIEMADDLWYTNGYQFPTNNHD